MTPLQLLRQLSFPVPQSYLIAGVGLALLLCRRYRIAMALILAAGTWLYLCSTPAFVSILRSGLELPYPALPASSYPVLDAIVVFGGDTIPTSGAVWQDDPLRMDQNRLGFALALYRAGRAPVMVLSAGKGGAVKMATIVQAEGLPKAALRIEPRARNTHENALYVAQILKREHRLHVLLVTSPFHMPRALAAFRKQGINPMAAPTEPTGPIQTAGHAWLPQRAALLRSRYYLHEYIGLWVYRIRGWA